MNFSASQEVTSSVTQEATDCVHEWQLKKYHWCLTDEDCAGLSRVPTSTTPHCTRVNINKQVYLRYRCALTFSREPLESPRPASPVRSSLMSIRPSLLRSSSSNSSAQRFCLSWSAPGGSLFWQWARGDQVQWGPMSWCQFESTEGSRSINSWTSVWHCTVRTLPEALVDQIRPVQYLGKMILQYFCFLWYKHIYVW